MMEWLLGAMFMVVVGLVGWLGNRIVTKQDQMQETLTQIKVDVAMLKSATHARRKDDVA